MDYELNDGLRNFNNHCAMRTAEPWGKILSITIAFKGSVSWTGGLLILIHYLQREQIAGTVIAVLINSQTSMKVLTRPSSYTWLWSTYFDPNSLK